MISKAHMMHQRSIPNIARRSSRVGLVTVSGAILVGLAGGLGLAGIANAATGTNGRIAFVECGPSSLPFTPDQCDIWVMNSDGSGQTNLTNTTDKNEVNPAWSPDGTRIAYFEGYYGGGLKIMNADGSNPSPSPITTTSTYPYSPSPTWSPGGTQIAFVRSNPGSPVATQADIVVVDLTSGTETVISRPVDFGGILLDADEFEPAWSPDGGKIAFVGVRLEQYLDPITGTPIQGAQTEIVTVNPDGSGEQIVSAGAAGTERAQFLEDDRVPAWSPDGSKLVFMSQDQILGCCGPWQIWAVNRDGTGATNLTNDATVNDMFPSWSPDGTQIVFSRANGFGGTNLYTMPAPSTLPLAAPVAAARLTTGTAVAAIAAAATPLAVGGDDPDWGRDPSVPPVTQQYSLFVAVELVGVKAGGSVESQPKGIRCGRDCSQSYPAGIVVTLKAEAKEGSAFVGWSGACGGASPRCLVKMSDVKSVKATFRRVR